MLARRLQPELMDDPALDAAAHRHALAGLARLNAFSRAGPGLWSHTRAPLGDRRDATILDVAVGSGDVLIDVVQRARREGIKLAPQAADVSAEAISTAVARARAAGVELITHRRDVVREGLGLADASVDMVVCSLFLHHLEATDATALLREMARVARIGVVVNDLVRSRRGVLAARVVSRLLSRSRVVRVDAVRSFEGAFTIDEMKVMAADAGMDGATVTTTWPFRMTLGWRRP